MPAEPRVDGETLAEVALFDRDGPAAAGRHAANRSAYVSSGDGAGHRGRRRAAERRLHRAAAPSDGGRLGSGRERRAGGPALDQPPPGRGHRASAGLTPALALSVIAGNQCRAHQRFRRRHPRWPLVGRLLRWRHARTSLQLVLLAAAAVVVLHGLFGPDLAPGNLATVLTWVHYRGLLVVALLAAGNLFCSGCPFVLVRDWGRRLHAPARLWPTRLRGKWIAVVLFVAVLFAYELFDLWALPRGTAYLVLAYFGAALVDRLRSSRARRSASTCARSGSSTSWRRRCRRSSCGFASRRPARRAGRRTASPAAASPEPPRQIVQRGCELGLFLPAKVGNIDCTFCLDCVQACPHDNIAHRACGRRARAGRCAPALGDRPAGQSPGHRGALGAVRVRRDAERVRDGRAGASTSSSGWRRRSARRPKRRARMHVRAGAGGRAAGAPGRARPWLTR